MKINTAETKLTIDGLRIAERRLSVLTANLEKKCALDEEKRQSRLSKYESLEVAQDAYGWGEITLDELQAIEDGLDDTPVTKYTIAHRAVKSCLTDIVNEIRELEWDLLTQPEKDRINAAREEIQARIAAKKGADQNDPS